MATEAFLTTDEIAPNDDPPLGDLALARAHAAGNHVRSSARHGATVGGTLLAGAVAIALVEPVPTAIRMALGNVLSSVGAACIIVRYVLARSRAATRHVVAHTERQASVLAGRVEVAIGEVDTKVATAVEPLVGQMRQVLGRVERMEQMVVKAIDAAEQGGRGEGYQEGYADGWPEGAAGLQPKAEVVAANGRGHLRPVD